MEAKEMMQQIAEKIGPQLEEFGVEAFVMCAYVRDGEGKVSRATLGIDSGNPAYQDGLRNINVAAVRWGTGQL